MKNLIDNLISYFNGKTENNNIQNAPNGVCPNCWGSQNWDGEFYKFLKKHNNNPKKNIYNNFIQDVARKLDKITLKSNTYVCETCASK